MFAFRAVSIKTCIKNENSLKEINDHILANLKYFLKRTALHIRLFYICVIISSNIKFD